MPKANGQITIVDLNDAILSGTAPENPVVGTLWIDTSVDPNKLFSWSGTQWIEQTLSIEGLDPEFHQEVDDLKKFAQDAANDGIITSSEKLNIKLLLVQITGDTLAGSNLPTLETIDTAKGGQVYLARAEALAAGIPTNHADYTSFETAYNDLKTYLDSLTPKPWQTGNTTIVTDTWTSKWDTYYEKLSKLAVTTSTYLANSIKPGEEYNGVTLTTEKGVVVLRGDNLFRTTLNATEGLSIEKNNAGTWSKVFHTNTDGKIYATGLVISSDSTIAGTPASTVKDNAAAGKAGIDDLSNDMKVTPSEKTTLSREWEAIKAEYIQVLAQATSLSVATAAYTTSYTNLDGATPKISAEVLVNMTSTYTFASTTVRDAFRTKINTYFSESEKIKKAISDKINSDAAAKATAAGDAAKELAQAIANGKMMYTDPIFKNGSNSAYVYNNTTGGFVTLSRIAKPSDAPTTSSHILEVKTSGAASPGLGGFQITINSRANAKFVMRIIAKIPVGYSITTASNSMGDGYSDKFLTPREGTGKYEEYIRLIKCGPTGTFSSGGHTYLSGPAATSEAPVSWQIAYATVFDATDNDYTVTDSKGKWDTAATDATIAKNTANTVTAVVAAGNANVINTNPKFLDWTGAAPAGYSTSTAGTGFSKVASANGTGNAARFVVAAGGNHYLSPTPVSNIPFYQYVTVEITFMLESGSIDGAGVLFRYVGTANTDHHIKLKSLVPSPVLNKFYTVTKTIKQESTPAGFASYQVYPMGGFPSFETVTSKTIQFDEVRARPSTEQEIQAYESNILVSDMSSDMKVTPLEKNTLKATWDSIKAEKTVLEAQSAAIGVSNSTYLAAYNAILNTTPKIEAEVLLSMSTTYPFASTAARDLFRTQFNTYYSEAQKLRRSIADKEVQDAKDYAVDLKSKDFGYRYKKDIVINGDANTYYPVILKSGNQNVMREIFINRAYNEQAPPDWNTATHKGGLTLKLKANFGGWGGALYKWEIWELQEMYSRMFAGTQICGNSVMFAIFLRGGGETGAVYHLYSDQALDANIYYSAPEGDIPPSPQIAYNQDLIFYSPKADGTAYTAYAPAPRTLTASVEQDLKDHMISAESIKNAQKAIDDMVSDLKVTPLEKRMLKQDWDAIKAEYPQLSAQASAYLVSSTAYVNAYNALNSTSPKIEAEVLATMDTTYTFASTALRDTFKTQMNTYISEREKLRKAISDSSTALAINQGYVVSNPMFSKWTGTFPDGFASWSSSTVSKETSLTRSGSAMRFSVAADSTQVGASISTSFFIPNLPNNKYYAVEVDFMLVSGDINGAGILLDWNGMSPFRTTVKLVDYEPSPTLGKWYTIRAIMKRPTDTLTGYTSMAGYLMANWASFAPTKIKNIIYDRLVFREPTAEEIKAYEVTTTENGSTVIDGAKIKTGSIQAESIDARRLRVRNTSGADTLYIDPNGEVTINGKVSINSSSMFAPGYDPSKASGGRNIALNSRFSTADMTNWANWGTATRVVEDITDLPGFDKAVKITTTASNQGLLQTVPVVNGNTYTASCYVKSSSGQATLQVFDGSGYPSKVMDAADAGANKWVKLYFVLTAKANTVQVQIGKSGGGSIGTYWFTGIKLEDGDKSTGWNPAQEDIDGLIDKVVASNGEIKAYDIASSLAIEPGAIDIISKNINIKGKVTFADLASGWALDELGNKISNSDQSDYDPANPLYLDVDGNYRPLTDEKNFLASLFTKDDETGITVIDGSYIKTGTILAKHANFRDVQVYNDSGQQTFLIDSEGNLSTSGTSQSIGYEEQKKGWRIDADGSAEFNAATFRGDIELGYYDAPSDTFKVTGGLLSGVGGTGKDLRFWAGNSKTEAPFKVYSDGTLEATKGYFTGTFSGEVVVGNISIRDTATVGDAKIILTDNSKIEKVVLGESEVKLNTKTTFGNFLTVDITNQNLSFGASDFKIDYKNNTIKMKSFSLKGTTALEFISDGSSGDDFVFRNVTGDTTVRVDGSFVARDDIEITDILRMKKATDAGNKGIDYVFI